VVVREGVQRAEYQSASDRNRAALQAQLLQQGFGQAQGSSGNNNINKNMGLAQAMLQQLAGKEISALTTLGGLGQSQLQAQLSAQQQLAQQQLYQPLSTAQQYGSGIMGLISGYPGGTKYNTNSFRFTYSISQIAIRCRCNTCWNI
jgi:6-phosphofructokinase